MNINGEKMNENISVLAGIVTFNPEIDRLTENILAICPQVEKVILVDNGSNNVSEIEKITHNLPEIDLIKFEKNLGIAAALNQIGDFAVAKKFDYFITMDQDSVALPKLIEEYKKYLYLLNIGLLNSYHKDRNLKVNKPQNTLVVENPRMITSGSFMKTSLFYEGFRYDEDLFIDKVDFDIDIALMRAGYKLYQIPFYGFLHEVGSIQSHSFLGIKTVTYNHSPFRRYYISRNSVILLKKYGLTKETSKYIVENIGKQIKTILFEDKKREKSQAVWRGFIDGVKYKKSLNKDK